MKLATGFVIMLMLVLWSSCQNDFEVEEFDGNLEFSKDTVFLDTVFSNLSTSTYSLKVYNRSREDIFIPEISLEKGESSMYRLNLDGIPGKTFDHIEILARDSLYIFIETTVTPEAEAPAKFLYLDKILFKSNAHLQEIPLVTLIKDAVLLYPSRDLDGFPEQIPVGLDENGEQKTVSGFFLKDEQLRLTSEKPYVIYGYAAVPSGKILKVDAGARLYFHSDSGIIVSKDASLHVEGAPSKDSLKLENEVIFQGDRLEGLYKNLAGQWGGIWLNKGSKDHILEHATIRNSGIGILVESSEENKTELQLKNVQIYNSAISGILAENAQITAENLVMNNSGGTTLHLRGGNYNFIHSTITNYWQQSFRQSPAVYLENNSGAGPTPLEANFYNSIIFGNEKRELLFNPETSAAFDVYFSHTLLKFAVGEETGLYDFSNKELYDNIWINEDPIFADSRANDLRLQKNSAAIDRGDPETANRVPLDILRTTRTPLPDLGAYEFIDLEE